MGTGIERVGWERLFPPLPAPLPLNLEPRIALQTVYRFKIDSAQDARTVGYAMHANRSYFSRVPARLL